MMLFGYVITNNNAGTDKGFWSPVPSLVVKLSDLYRKYFGTLDQRGNYRWSWDYWSRQDELTHRRLTALLQTHTCRSQCDSCHTPEHCVASVTRIGDLLLCAECAKTS